MKKTVAVLAENVLGLMTMRVNASSLVVPGAIKGPASKCGQAHLGGLV